MVFLKFSFQTSHTGEPSKRDTPAMEVRFSGKELKLKFMQTFVEMRFGMGVAIRLPVYLFYDGF